MELFYIAIGGALGALSRSGIAIVAQKMNSNHFHLGTMFVNLVGAFLIGIIWQLSTKFTFHSSFKPFLLVGFLGAFTTFSSFALEGIRLLQTGQYRMAIFNLLFQNIFGLLAVIAGIYLINRLVIN